MRIRYIALCMGIFCCMSVAWAQDIPIEKFKIQEQLDSLFKTTRNTAGVAVTVLHHGQVIARKSYGMANLEHNIPFSHRSPVRLGYSGGREFMCVGLAIMEEEKLLRLNDRVKKYIPGLPAWSDDVIIQDLLNHSSGFDDEWATLLLMHADMNIRVTKEQFLNLLYNQPRPQVDPGKGYMYSNSDFALLRLIMETVSGRSLPEYLKEKVFEPLSMTSTFMNDDLSQLIPGFAENYSGANGRFFKSGAVKTSPGGNYRIVTTANDLERWALAIEDTASFVCKAFQRLYEDARAIPVLSPERHYVFGHEWHTIHQTELIKHGGVNRDYYMFRIPSQNLSVIGLGNSWTSMAMAMQIMDSLLPAKTSTALGKPVFPNKQVTFTKEQLGEYAGRYFEKGAHSHSSHIRPVIFYDLKVENGQLSFYYSTTNSFPMTPFGNGLFKDMDFDVPMRFTQSHPDSAMKLQIWTIDGKVVTLSRDDQNRNDAKSYLQQFTGQFHSPHLDYYCRILLNDKGQLIIKRPTVPDKVLEFYGENRFLFEMDHLTDSWYVVSTFTKDKNGRVDGIELQHTRMTHHRFDKVK